MVKVKLNHAGNRLLAKKFANNAFVCSVTAALDFHCKDNASFVCLVLSCHIFMHTTPGISYSFLSSNEIICLRTSLIQDPIEVEQVVSAAAMLHCRLPTTCYPLSMYMQDYPISPPSDKRRGLQPSYYLSKGTRDDASHTCLLEEESLSKFRGRNWQGCYYGSEDICQCRLLVTALCDRH